MRLTRRGRIVLVALSAALLLVGLWLTAGRDSQAGAATPPRPLPTVVVGDGDTLWDIALRVKPHADPRVTVQRILQLNHLGDVVVEPGLRLAVPR